MKAFWKKAAAAAGLALALTVALSAAAVVSGPLKPFMNAPLAELFSGVITARADVIWEPEDPFYTTERWEKERRDDFVLNGRSYFANGEEGYIYVTENPENQTVTDALQNGTVVFVSFTYETDDGTQWGVIQYERGQDGQVTPNYGGNDPEAEVFTGWIRMEDIALIYDSTAFREDHAEELVPADGTETVELEGEGDMNYWTYPGSGVVSGTTSYVDDKLKFQDIYTDEDGLEWGYVNYYYGQKDSWVCLSDPTSISLPVRSVVPENVIAPKEIPEDLPTTLEASLGEAAESPSSPDGHEASETNVTLVLLLVVLAIAASGAVIRIVYRKNS